MRPYEGADLLGLERAIRTLEPLRAPDRLRSTLRSELLSAASARPARGPFAAPFSAAHRITFAAAGALLLLASGWTIAASAPGDVLYPIKEAIVRLISVPERQDLPPMDSEVIEAPITEASTRPGPVPTASAIPAVPLAPDAPIAPAAPLPNASPTAPIGSTQPARATPAVPPAPPGPRATPAVPPTR
jgi:hypothetical protein